MNKYQLCSRCRFWVSVRKLGTDGGLAGFSSRQRRATRGQCHRYAPRAQALSPRWPSTKADDSCGEFKPRPDERREVEAPAPETADDPDTGRGEPNG